MKPRLRPTFLCRFIVLIFFLGIIGVVFRLSPSSGVNGVTLIVLVLIWSIGIEGGLLLVLAERLLARWAGESLAPFAGLFFRNTDREDRIKSERFSKGTRDNPTIR